jgi:hypothetical protein
MPVDGALRHAHGTDVPFVELVETPFGRLRERRIENGRVA